MILQSFNDILDLKFRKLKENEWNVGLEATTSTLFYLKANGYSHTGTSKPAKFIRIFKGKTFTYEDNCRWDIWGAILDNEIYVCCSSSTDTPEKGIKLSITKEL